MSTRLVALDKEDESFAMWMCMARAEFSNLFKKMWETQHLCILLNWTDY